MQRSFFVGVYGAVRTLIALSSAPAPKSGRRTNPNKVVILVLFRRNSNTHFRSLPYALFRQTKKVVWPRMFGLPHFPTYFLEYARARRRTLVTEGEPYHTFLFVSFHFRILVFVFLSVVTVVKMSWHAERARGAFRREIEKERRKAGRGEVF